uniref:IrrE N-terminal-like domain-containing protein n=1 Tax=Candidatus Kentrum sp. TUN TaxID=2126343 RepID=A0A451AWK6_9GAMM|nr:MAG: protein of unknown function (DUF955) [Candidatus Kentron sp. TUN]VFK70412.1 MAG: protein of unknown function (DUF955) [Candidatus Kentron sp. TUN]
MTDKSISFKSAKGLLDHFDLGNETPIDVDDVASKLGIDVEDHQFEHSDDIVGEIAFNDDSPVIRINPNQNKYNSRRRFTIAHEIGHYCLMYRKNKISEK